MSVKINSADIIFAISELRRPVVKWKNSKGANYGVYSDEAVRIAVKMLNKIVVEGLKDGVEIKI